MVCLPQFLFNSPSPLPLFSFSSSKNQSDEIKKMASAGRIQTFFLVFFFPFFKLDFQLASNNVINGVVFLSFFFHLNYCFFFVFFFIDEKTNKLLPKLMYNKRNHFGLYMCAFKFGVCTCLHR